MVLECVWVWGPWVCDKFFYGHGSRPRRNVSEKLSWLIDFWLQLFSMRTPILKVWLGLACLTARHLELWTSTFGRTMPYVQLLLSSPGTRILPPHMFSSFSYLHVSVHMLTFWSDMLPSVHLFIHLFFCLRVLPQDLILLLRALRPVPVARWRLFSVAQDAWLVLLIHLHCIWKHCVWGFTLMLSEPHRKNGYRTY